MVLQILLGEPVLILDALEDEKVLGGNADMAKAEADMALNNAVHNEFGLIYRSDRQQAVEQLRCSLKDEC